MAWKCTPQIIGLVRGEPTPGKKHRANGQKICDETGNERFSKSVTLDRTRSILNEYEGQFFSGKKCWEMMEDDAENYRITGKTKNGKTFERGLRHDAVIGWAMIFNPPTEVSSAWTREMFEQFYEDSFEVMCEIEPRLFRKQNITMKAKHRDEGLSEDDEHEHLVGFAKDENGKYCGNLIDANLCVRINQNYPRLMRARGWDIADLDMTDFKRMATDPDYKAERTAKRRHAGRSVNRYIADKAKETAGLYPNALQTLQEAVETLSEAETIKAAAEADKREIEALLASVNDMVTDTQTWYNEILVNAQNGKGWAAK